MEAIQKPKLKKSKGHKCYLCGNRFQTIHILRKHVNTHKDKEYECELCEKLFSSNWGLKKHMQIHTGERPHKCIYCNKTFRQKSTMTEHVEKLHKNSNQCSYCQTCGKRLKSSANKFQCWFCSYLKRPLPSIVESFLEENSKAVEIITANEVTGEFSNAQSSDNGEFCANSNDGCRICKEQISDDDEDFCKSCRSKPLSLINMLAEESKRSTELTTYGWNSYNSKITSPNNPDVERLNIETVIDTVIETASGHVDEIDKKTTCMQCMQVFPNISALRQHIAAVHKPHWQYTCEHCSAKFATMKALENHSLLHMESRPFSCMVCCRPFKSQFSLKAHLLTHRVDRPFKCKRCGLPFKTMFALKAHTVVHQQERPFICRECGFAFKLVEHLKRHTIVHTGEMPYKCDECGKAFRYLGNLARHQYLHTKERLYVCNICGKDFAQSTGLKQHEQVHNKNYNAEKNLVCPICGKAYKLMRQLRRHITIHR